MRGSIRFVFHLSHFPIQLLELFLESSGGDLEPAERPVAGAVQDGSSGADPIGGVLAPFHFVNENLESQIRR